VHIDRGFHLERAQRYVSAMSKHPSARRQELRQLRAALESLAIPKAQIIVDLGAGQGFLSNNLLIEFLAADGVVFAIDSSEDMLSHVSYSAMIQKSVCKLEALPCKNNCVDLVVSLAMFHHVTNKKQVVFEIKRILRPGAYFVIADVLACTGTQAFFDNVVTEHCTAGHDFDFLDANWVDFLARAAGMMRRTSVIQDTPWEFASNAGMLEFLRDIFSLDLAEDNLFDEVNRYLPVYSNGVAAACLPWQLGFHVLEKPA
jgi:SAM-dependent methyltransferase